MTGDGTPKDDVKVPDSDLGKDIQAGFDEGKDLLVTIISAMSEEQVSLPYFLWLLTSFPPLYRCPYAHCHFLGHFLQGSPQGQLIGVYIFPYIGPREAPR
jgi:hypothetical protein